MGESENVCVDQTGCSLCRFFCFDDFAGKLEDQLNVGDSFKMFAQLRKSATKMSRVAQ
jgi:hypothetical protein